MDFLYFLVILMFFAALIAQARVKSTYSKYSQRASSKGITAQQAVRIVLESNGVNDIEIKPVAGDLTDHFNPKDNTINLSEPVYNSTSIAAIGVACHEAGHAVQHAKSYLPIKVRNAIVPACNIGSHIGIPLAFLGLFISNEIGEMLIIIGLALYALAAVFQLITLPVELDASHRALKAMDEAGILTDDEQPGARKVLTAAAMTYVVALVTAIVNLLRIIFIFAGRRRD